MQRRAKIFIVENHKDTLQSLKLYFEDLGHKVETADTVAGALSSLRAYQPDIMLCDIGLPDGTGWDLLRQIDPKPPMAVAMSGFGMHADNARSREAGFSAHLVKPFKVAELDKILAEANSEQARPEPKSEPGSSTKLHDVAQVIERAQRRVGEQLHDELCQTLAGFSLLLTPMGRAVADGKPVPLEIFQKLNALVERAITQTRALSQQFAPVRLEGSGLMLALQNLAAETANCVFECDQAVFVGEEEVALALFRIAQEAVANAVRHSKAKSIQINLRKEKDQVELRVNDDGKGFDADVLDGTWKGIATMKLWAGSVGGVCEVQSAPGKGTGVQCRVRQK